MNRHATQGKLIVRALKRRPHTYMQMLALGVSVCPWRRVEEAMRLHFSDHELVKGKTREGHTTWRVIGPTRWTA